MNIVNRQKSSNNLMHASLPAEPERIAAAGLNRLHSKKNLPQRRRSPYRPGRSGDRRGGRPARILRRHEDTSSLVRLGDGKHQRKVQAAMTDRTGTTGVDPAGSQDLPKQMLRDFSIPVPEGKIVREPTEKEVTFSRVAFLAGEKL